MRRARPALRPGINILLDVTETLGERGLDAPPVIRQIGSMRAGANQFLERAAAREEFRAERARQRHGFTEQGLVDGGDRVMCTSELYI